MYCGRLSLSRLPTLFCVWESPFKDYFSAQRRFACSLRGYQSSPSQIFKKMPIKIYKIKYARNFLIKQVLNFHQSNCEKNGTTTKLPKLKKCGTLNSWDIYICSCNLVTLSQSLHGKFCEWNLEGEKCFLLTVWDKTDKFLPIPIFKKYIYINRDTGVLSTFLKCFEKIPCSTWSFLDPWESATFILLFSQLFFHFFIGL